MANLEQDKNKSVDKEEELLSNQMDANEEVADESEPVGINGSDSKSRSADKPISTDTKPVEQEDSQDFLEEIGEVEDVGGVEQAKETSEETDSESNDISATEFYEAILEKAKQFVTRDDWALVSDELAYLAFQIEEGPEPSSDAVRGFIKIFKELRDEFEERKRAHYEELNQKKAANLLLKKEVLGQLSDIIKEKKWTFTKEVNQLRGRWENIKPIPQSEADALSERFEALLTKFENHKVDRLVKKRQKEEENFALKLLILEKMDALNEKLKFENADFEELSKEFHDLLIQWKKVGRVLVEKNQQVWDHFHASYDSFNQLRLKYDKRYRETVEKALEEKKKLIKEAESLMDEEDLALAIRRVNKLHNLWKKTGNLPQKEENEIWDIFRTATDAFNDKKAQNIHVLRDQEQKNLDKKLALIERAKAYHEVSDFEEGHQAMQKLIEEWKQIGPTPRKKSSKAWIQFKEAMDVFYEKRRDHFKDVKKDQKQNLTLKNGLIKKLKELSESDDAALAVEETKKIQTQFKQIGHVPLKFKNKIWKEYREICNVIYNQYRSSGSDLGLERKRTSQGIEPTEEKDIVKYRRELDTLKKDIPKLEGEIIQYQEAKTYFKPTGKGNKLRGELQEKIDKAERVLSSKKERLSSLKRKIREIRTANEE